MHRIYHTLQILIAIFVFSASSLFAQHLTIKRHTDPKFAITLNTKSLKQDSNDKMGPVLRHLLQDSTTRALAVLSQKNTGEKTRYQVLVNSKNSYLTASVLEQFGASVQTIAGEVLVVEASKEVIEQIISNEEISSLKASLTRHLHLNDSRTETQINLIHNGFGLDTTYEGEDVVVGIVDSGIDEDHPDFNTTDGSRIQYLWDMSGSGKTPPNFNYGREYTKADIDAGLCEQTDEASGLGHGTHVAGIAVGNGRGKSGYIGMAPKADIVFVKGFRNGPGFTDGDIINACNYIFQKADALGKKAVINLSLGGHVGPHDGTSALAKALTNLSDKGKIIVASAGNEGSELVHLSYTATGSDFSTAKETLFEVSDKADKCYLSLWYPSGSIFVGLAAYTKSGTLIGRLQTAVGPGESLEGNFTINNTTYARVLIDASNTNDPGNGDNEVFVVISSENGQYTPSSVNWSLYTYGAGTFDGWIANGNFLNASGSKIENPDNEKSVAIPATANDVFGVGSYVTKTKWTDIDGSQWSQNGATLNEISSFSSIGPSRDGRLKPEVTAPGEVIIAALSSDLIIGTDILRSHVVQGGELRKFQGTSMSAPHVTGAIALMLQKNPQATYDTLLAAIQTNSDGDSFTGSLPNETWGYGKMNAYKAFLSLSESDPDIFTDTVNVLSQNILVDQNGSSVIIPFSIPSSESKPVLQLEIYDVLGRKVKGVDVRKNELQITLNLNQLASGMYFYRIKGYKDIKRILIVR